MTGSQPPRLGTTPDADLRIHASRTEELKALLRSRTEETLFQLTVLEERGVTSAPGESPYCFVGWPQHGPLRAAVFLGGRWFTAPFAPDPADAAALGQRLRGVLQLRRAVGERNATDAFWSQWPADEVETVLSHPQRLMRIRQGDPVPARTLPGLRPAVPSEERAVHEASAEMQIEELGVDPRLEEPSAFRAQVAERIRSGRTWVLVENGRIVFKAEVALRSRYGAQIGGVWVPPSDRGRGLASSGMSDLTRRLLERNATVSLHVHERNAPALAAYRRAGYVEGAAFRLYRGRPASP